MSQGSAATQGYAPADGTRLFYEISGTGPPLVLLHGFSFDTRMWNAQLPELAETNTVIRYDLRGFGKSAAGDVAYSHADDLLALLDHLKVDRVSLMGLSLGGGAAINFAMLHPERVRALIVVDPSLGGFKWSSDYGTAQGNLRSAAMQLGPDAARALWLSMPMFQSSIKKPEVAMQVLRIVGDYPGTDWMTPDLGRPFSPPAIERLAEIRARTLILVGEFDVPDFQDIAATLERGIAGARKVKLAGVGHMANLENPVLFNETVLDFLSTVHSGDA